MDIVFSGIQPTGSLHIGNYLGAIKNWIELQSKYHCIFCVVDLHAITMPYNSDELTKNVYNTLASYLACDIDVSKNIVFRQSDVPEHAELCWLLSCIVQHGKLNSMIQFKEKLAKNKEKTSIGLYTYPVLMASDILLYKADWVPVGNDQSQHVELTREIAGTFNHRYNTQFFPEPKVLFNANAARIMSLKNASNKMSKSDFSEHSRINLSDNADIIRKKIAKATTDSTGSIIYDQRNRAEVANLINVYTCFSDCSIDDVVNRYSGYGYAKFKSDLADIIVDAISPISIKLKELLADYSYLSKILHNNAEKAKSIAAANIKEIKYIMGIR
ncbi:Tryptophan--tRNA ligase [Candidatus Xenohaliotis californiensis]|uniref:Tryptophan--tRNA ligase n=1 Tax=Candidatus Xenohaliotis californiensis TaxID=84677 RepID=A0ABM9N9I1_9RICK|nr:Tryptophan--tRNA ligase [Candidatus Xenohaliotis californiensis]